MTFNSIVSSKNLNEAFALQANYGTAILTTIVFLSNLAFAALRILGLFVFLNPPSKKIKNRWRPLSKGDMV